MRRDAWMGTLSWWSCESLAAHGCGLLNHVNSFHRGMFKLNAKFDGDSLLYLLSHFESDEHTVHTLTQWHLPPPLASEVKLSLFMHGHSSPLSLAARLHQFWANCSHYINNGWTFSRQATGGLKTDSSDIKPNPCLEWIYNPEGKYGLNRGNTNNMQ